MGSSAVDLRPIQSGDVPAVGRFLHEHLNQSVAPDSWAKVMRPPWGGVVPNHGFQLVKGDTVVGAYLAVYSERDRREGQVRLCNLAAFCVLGEFRMLGLRLVRALLAQTEYAFTDFSPSGNVIALNERLGFRHLDTSTRLVANLPDGRRHGVDITGDPAVLEGVLRGLDADIYRDHREASAARHLVVLKNGEYAYLIFRRDRRKGLPVFASPLYAGGDRTLLKATWSGLRSHILLDHHLPATLAEHRILGFDPGVGIELPRPRPKMVRGGKADPTDYLYSELALVEW